MSTPTDKVDETPHDEVSHSYTSHNYEAMNRAIDTEVDKRFELNELYQFQKTSRRTLMLLHITTSLCVVAVTAAVIYWLFFQQPSQAAYINTGPTQSPSNGAFDRSTSDALSVISKQEKSGEAEKHFIDTSFTVFHRTLIPTGEYVVTGKTYQPENLKTPDEQYCYLEKSQSSKALAGQPLASIDAGDFTLETDDKELISFARKYCQFSRR